MKLTKATNLDRKSGGAQWRACPERSRRGPAVLCLSRSTLLTKVTALPFFIPSNRLAYGKLREK